MQQSESSDNGQRGEGGQISGVKKPTGEVGFLLSGLELVTLAGGELPLTNN